MRQLTASDYLDEIFTLGPDFYYLPQNELELVTRARLIRKEQYLTLDEEKQKKFIQCSETMIASSVINIFTGPRIIVETVKSKQILNALAERLAPDPATLDKFLKGQLNKLGDDNSPAQLRRYLFKLSPA